MQQDLSAAGWRNSVSQFSTQICRHNKKRERKKNPQNLSWVSSRDVIGIANYSPECLGWKSGSQALECFFFSASGDAEEEILAHAAGPFFSRCFV